MAAGQAVPYSTSDVAGGQRAMDLAAATTRETARAITTAIAITELSYDRPPNGVLNHLQ